MRNFGFETRAINRIAHKRMTNVSHMHANLMRASGLESHAQQRVRGIAMLDTVVRDRLATIGAHGHPRALRAMSADRFGDRATTGDEAFAEAMRVALVRATGKRAAAQDPAFAALRADPATRAMRIAITANDGVVSLGGTLEPGLEEAAAIRVTSAVPRVRQVKSELKLLTPSRLKLGL